MSRRGSANAWPPTWPVIQPSPSRGCARSASSTCAASGLGKGSSSSVDGGLAPRCTWASLMPGTTRWPCRSIRCVSGPASARIVASSPTAVMRPSSIASALAEGRAGSPVQTRPLCRIRSVATAGIAASNRRQAGNRRIGVTPGTIPGDYASCGCGRSVQPRALRGERFELAAPVGQALALLLDHRRRHVAAELRQLRLALALFGRDLGQLLVQPRALGGEVDQAFQRDEQLQLADDAGRGRRWVAGQGFDALDAVEEFQLRREALGACAIVGIAVLQQPRDRLRRRHAQFAAAPETGRASCGERGCSYGEL